MVRISKQFAQGFFHAPPPNCNVDLSSVRPGPERTKVSKHMVNITVHTSTLNLGRGGRLENSGFQKVFGYFVHQQTKNLTNHRKLQARLKVIAWR